MPGDNRDSTSVARSDQAHRPAAQITNVLSFDVEDYFHVSNFENIVSFDDWGKFESRVETNTHKILDVLGERGIAATFFVLGWVAEKFPHLVRAIADGGHEVGTHSYRHRLIYTLDPKEFRSDLRQSIDLVEQASGQKVLGHRAPSFSITEQSLWAIDVMMQEGLRYDSSVFPIHHHRYGIPSAPRAPYEIRPGFWEFPIATAKLGKTNLPVAGGGYFRLYPYAITRWGMRQMNTDKLPVMVYLHPWEFDPDQPRLNASMQARFRHYNNLGKTTARLRRLCQEFQFTTARKALAL
jgi:polysaccharide deacetylase family protein (PEP-CTERM system associated)